MDTESPSSDLSSETYAVGSGFVLIPSDSDGLKQIIDIYDRGRGNEIASNFLAIGTGLVTSDKKENFSSLSNILQASLRGKGIDQFGKELKKLKDKGSLKEEVVVDPNFSDSISKILETIESGASEDKVTAMKALFFKMVEEGLYGKNSPNPRLMMQTLGELSSLEIIVMQSLYLVNGRKEYEESDTVSQSDVWSRIVVQAGINREYVERAWKDLGKRGLILRGTGLTTLGVNLCELIESYVPEK